MVPGKNQIKNKTENEFHEFEKLLGAVLSPVPIRDEFVDRLQERLEFRYNPKPLIEFPQNIQNYILYGAIGIISGIILVVLGVNSKKWLKKTK